MAEKKAITEVTSVTKDGQLQVRRTTITVEDGKEIKEYHRHVVAPGDSLINEDEEVKKVANTLWTPEVIKVYQDKIKT